MTSEQLQVGDRVYQKGAYEKNRVLTIVSVFQIDKENYCVATDFKPNVFFTLPWEQFTKIDLLVGDVVTVDVWGKQYYKILSIFKNLQNNEQYVIQHSSNFDLPLVIDRIYIKPAEETQN